MSNTTMSEYGSSSSSSSSTAVLAAAPKLAGATDYARWRPMFLNYCVARGLKNTLETEIPDWTPLVERVQQWDKLETQEMMARALGKAAPSSSSVKVEDSEKKEEEMMKKHIRALLERSYRVYGALFEAMPAELRPQVAHLPDVPHGNANALWKWLSTKYQSTEADHVATLFRRWESLRQEDNESFDAYRARVNELSLLLGGADEKPSARRYAYTLLDKLLPHYGQAVLALKAGGALKDAKSINWDNVVVLINNHEKSTVHSETSSSSSEGAVAAAAVGKGIVRNSNSEWKKVSFKNHDRRGRSGDRRSSPPPGGYQGPSMSNERRAKMKELMDRGACLRCEKIGHFAFDCTAPLPASKNKFQRREGEGNNERAAAAHKEDGEEEEDEESGIVFAAIAMRGCPLLMEDECEEEESHITSYAQAAVRKSRQTAKRTGTHEKQQQQVAAAATDLKRLKRPGEFKLNTPPAPVATVSPQPVSTVVRTNSGVKLTPNSNVKLTPNSGSTKANSSVKLTPNSASSRNAKRSMSERLATTDWGIDSMASCHITGNKSLLVGMKSVTPLTITVADGATVTVSQKGSVRIRVMNEEGKTIAVEIEDVYYHERFTTNLLSVGMLRQLKWEMHMTSEESYLITKGKNKILLDTGGKIFMLNTVNEERVYAALAAAPAYSSVDDLVRLHERFVHMNFDRMMEIINGGHTDGIGKVTLNKEDIAKAKKRVQECEACCKAKMTKTPYGHKGLHKGTAPHTVMHMDSYTVTDKRGDVPHHYGVALHDPHGKGRWFVDGPTKDVLSSRILTVLKKIETQSGVKLKEIYCDGGTEFIKEDIKRYCREKGIELHWPPAGEAQLRGIAERSVSIMKDGARTLLIHAGLPTKYWREATAHFVYMWNRLVISPATGVTPYEALMKRKPSMQHIGIFGSDAWVQRPKEDRATFDAKAEACIYMGHDEVQGCAIVHVIRTQKVIRTRNLKHRATFTHAGALKSGDVRMQRLVQEIAPEWTPADITSEETTAAVEVLEMPDGTVTEVGGKNPLSAAESPTSGGVIEQQSPKLMPKLAPSEDLSSDSDIPDGEYEIERIVGMRERNGRIEYEVKWKGYDEEDNTWEPLRSLMGNASEAVADFEAEEKAKEASTNAIAHMAFCAIGTEFPNGAKQEEQMEHIIAALSAAMKTGEELTEAALSRTVNDRYTPTTYKEAMNAPEANKWLAAMNKEIKSCEDKGTWIKIRKEDLPKEANPIPCKWVYKVKTDENDKVTEYKARLTPKGFKQKYGVDYFEVFARTGMYKTLRLGLALAAMWDYELDQMDVPSAFLCADVPEDIYMQMPEGFSESGFVLKLIKALYGLKQAPRAWWLLISKFLKERMGFQSTVSDPCLFWKRSKTGRLILLFLFVDDFQVAYHKDDKTEWNELKAKLVKEYNTKDMGPSTWILGMRIKRDRANRTITLDQELYVTKALNKFGFGECKTADTPMVTGNPVEDTILSKKPADKEKYMEIVGTLLYAAISTRPDIAYAVQKLTRSMQSPMQSDMIAAERVLRYLAGTKSMGLSFGNRGAPSPNGDKVEVSAFADADWANDRVDRKSVSGWVAKVNGDVISWASKKQHTVSQSTCEAELYAEAAAVNEILWLRGMLTELGLEVSGPSVLSGDNQSTQTISKNGVKTERTKHVDVKYHFVTQQIEDGVIQLEWVESKYQQADVFTKALAAPLFEHFRSNLMTN